MNNINTAYIAGLLDGDGCFSLTLQSGVLRPQVIIYVTDRDIILWLRKVIGLGNISQSSRKTVTGKSVYRYIVSRHEHVGVVLGELLPYLRIKQRVATLLYEYVSSHEVAKGYRCREQKLTDREVEIYEEMRRLNS